MPGDSRSLSPISRRSTLARIFGAAASVGIIGCESRDDSQPASKLTVYVVGSGVSLEREDVTSATRNELGWAIKSGVRAAALEHAVSQGLKLSPKMFAGSLPKRVADKLPFTLVFVDDDARPDEAARIAQRIQRDPRALAVIGHASSGTTYAALPYYSEARIPLFMPIATSSAMPACKGQRTWFRLPPRDDKAQVPAIKFLLKELISAQADGANDKGDTFVVWDCSRRDQEARTYSGPMFEQLKQDLGLTDSQSMRVSHEEANFDKAARSIVTNNSRAVVFCGYASTVPSFFAALDEAYAGKPKPIVVLTDGCRDTRASPQAFETYLSFPLKPLAEGSFSTLKAMIAKDVTESYQPYSYDAMMVLLEAVTASNASLGRRGIVEYLEKTPKLSSKLHSGVTGFLEGESTSVRGYEVYKLADSGSGADFVHQPDLSPNFDEL